MQKKIVLIEDNAEMRENTAELLEFADYEVFPAENGKVGIDKVKQVKPDIVICDIMMPEYDGYDVLYMLSKDLSTSAIPFIFLTAKTEKSDVRKGMSLGADDYLMKPYTEAELLEAVEMRLTKSRKLKEFYSRDEEGLRQFINEARGFEQLKNLSVDRKIRKFKKKEMIFHEGDNPTYLYFINSGKVKAFRMNGDGKEFIIDLYNEGDFFGYMALLENGVYQESAVALEETDVSLIPRSDFNLLLQSNRDVAARFIKMLSNNILEKEEKLLRIAYSSVRLRVAEALLQLHDKYNKEKVAPFTISISRDDLASLVGTATETVIRTLSEFKDEKLIEAKASHITILNAKALLNLRY
jgi:CRP/FNR family transcriptional regulator, polysaccharide utilization system transcription regulator